MSTATVLDQPAAADLDLATIMGALADAHRLAIVRALADDGERVCGTFDLGIVEGTRRFVSLRREDLEARFPGLLDALLDAAGR
jgi:hypothetical protein